MNNKAYFPLVCALLLVLIGAGCKEKTPAVTEVPPTDDSRPPVVEPKETGAIFVDEKNFDGETLTIREVDVSRFPAWLVIYENQNGQPGRPLNYVLINSDQEFNVQVSLSSSEEGDRVSALLHTDTGKEKFFDFPEADLPFDQMTAVTFMLTQK